MNAARPIIQIQANVHAAQQSTPAAATSSQAQAGGQDFAGAMNEAVGKPAHKSGSDKASNIPLSGLQLPAAGNSSPPPATPSPAGIVSLPAAQTLPAAAEGAEASALLSTAPNGQSSASGSISGPASAPAIAATATAAGPDAAPAADAAPQVQSAAATLAATVAATAQAATAATASAANAAASAANAAASTAPPIALADAELAGPAVGPAAGPAPAVTELPARIDAGATQTPAALATRAAQSIEGQGAAVRAAAASASLLNRSAAPNRSVAANRGAADNGSVQTSAAAQGDAPAAAAGDLTSQSLSAAALRSSADNAADSSAMVAATDSGAPQGGTTADVVPALSVAAVPPSPAAALSSAAITSAASAAASTLEAAAFTSALDKHAQSAAADTSLTGSGIDGAAGAAQLLTNPTASADTTPMPAMNVTARVDSAEFGQGVADRVSLMMDSNLSSAKLQVNPPALGPIEVTIALQGGHAQVWLMSHSALTRDALEASSPKLREMLGAQGFGQVSVDISQRSFQDRTPQSKGYEATPAIDDGGAVSVPAAASTARAASGLLDAYA